jgi:hypothetical protein
MNSESAKGTSRVVGGGPWRLMNNRSHAKTPLTRCAMARSNVTLQFDGSNVTPPTVFVDLDLTGVDALIQRCAIHAQDACSFDDFATKKL